MISDQTKQLLNDAISNVDKEMNKLKRDYEELDAKRAKFQENVNAMKSRFNDLKTAKTQYQNDLNGA